MNSEQFDGTSPTQRSAAERYADLPLSFEASQGQADSQARFISRGNGYSFFLTQQGTLLTFSQDGESAATVLKMQLAGANKNTTIRGMDELPGKSNYFFGSDSHSWRTGVPTFSKVAYENVYRGVNLVYYGNQRQLEYDFVVSPGANPRQIRLSFSGAEKLSVDSQGNLVLHNASGDVQLLAPKVYQQVDGHKQEIVGHWILGKDNVAGFRLGSYDRTRALVIDPVLTYSSFLGGSQSNTLTKIAIDAAGNAYVAGQTTSGDFPAAPTPQSMTFGGGSASRGAFVAKIDPTGSNLLYTTYLSGSVDEEATGLAVDKSGNVYVAGTTHSPDFPTHNAYQSTCNTHAQAGTCSSAFLAKIGPTGDSLVFSTYLGGSGGESGRSLAVDAAGNAYLIGTTSSVDFPVTAGAAQAKCGGACQQNAFVARFNATGDSLAYATYLGGSGTDDAAELAIDPAGSVYVTGRTTSADFPVATPFQHSCTLDATSTAGACVVTAFVTKIKPDGSSFEYSTYLGGSLGSQASGIAVDSLGNAYVTGSTQSPDFPLQHAFQKSCGIDAVSHACSVDAFVTKLAPSGNSLLYSTYLGGSGRDEASGIVLDSAGNAHIVGRTESADFPTAASLQAHLKGTSDAFVARLSADGTALTFSTYHGGSALESGSGIALDGKGSVYLTGQTSSSDFPTHQAFQSSCAGACTSAFVTKMSAIPQVTAPPTISKNFGAATIPLNGTTSLSFTITNPNAATTLTGIGFTDTLPAGLAVSTPNGLSGTCGGGTITATAGSTSISLSGASLAGAASCTFSVNNDGVAAGTNVNTTSAVTSVEGGNGGSASASIDVVAPPTIAKAFNPTTIALNATTSLQFTITNPAANAVAETGVAFTDTLPTGLTVANATASVCGGTLTTTAPTGISLVGATIAVSGQCQFSITTTGAVAGNYTNTTGTVSSTNGGTGGTASAKLTVVAPPSIAKAFNPTRIALGATSSLQFTITNPAANTVAEAGVAFTDTLPVGLTVATSTSTVCGGTLTTTNPTGISLVGATIAANGQCQFSVTVTGASGGNYTNTTGPVSSTNGGTGNTATANLQVSSPATITKAFGAATIVLNNSTSLTLTITNPNTTIALTGVAVTDSLPAGLVVATPNGLSNTCGGTATATAGSSSVSLTNGTLATSASCTIVVNVTGTTSGAKNNTTGAVTSIEGGTGSPSNTATVTVQDYNWAISSSTATVIEGQSTSITTSPVLTATPISGYSQNIAVSCTVAPVTATVTCTPVPATITGGNGSSTVTINTTAATPVGVYTVTISGTDSSTVPLKHSQPFTLTVECTWNVGAGPTVNADATTGGKYSIALAVASGGTQCPWSVTGATSSWIHPVAASGIGSSTVLFDVDSFYGAADIAPRTGSLNFDFTNGTNGAGFTQPTGSSTVTQNEVVMNPIAPSSTSTVHVNTGATIPYTTSATNTGNPNALWSLTGTCNGPCGNITAAASTTGTYTAPANIAGSAAPHTSATDTVSAASQADPSKLSANTPTVNILNDQPLCTGAAAVMPDPVHSAASDPVNNPVAVKVQHVCTDNQDNENDLQSATVLWGDGSPSPVITFSNTGVASGTINPAGTDANFSHAYAAANFNGPAYAVTVSPSDTSLATAPAASIVPTQVIITHISTDPAALFVTAAASNSQPLPTGSQNVTFTFGSGSDPCSPATNANGFNISGIVRSDGTTDPANFGITCSLATNATFQTLTVNTTAATNPATAARPKLAASLVLLSLGVPCVVLLGLGFSGSRRSRRMRRVLGVLGILTIIAAFILLPACGGGISVKVVNPGTKNVVYFLALTGTSGGAQQTYIVPLTVAPQQ